MINTDPLKWVIQGTVHPMVSFILFWMKASLNFLRFQQLSFQILDASLNWSIMKLGLAREKEKHKDKEKDNDKDKYI